MALTVQRKLELAGDLARVQPLLQRLHLVEKPKKRFGGRNVILVSGVIAAVAGEEDPQADSLIEDALTTTSDL